MPLDADLKSTVADPDTPGTALLTWLIANHGTGVTLWHPSAWRDQIKADSGVDPPDSAIDRVAAAACLLIENGFWVDPRRFVVITNALNGLGQGPFLRHMPDAVECAEAVTEAALLREDGEDGAVFSDEVRRLIGKILGDEGYLSAPDVLAIAELRPHAPADVPPEVVAEIRNNQADKVEAVRQAVTGRLVAITRAMVKLLPNFPNAHKVAALAERAATRESR